MVRSMKNFLSPEKEILPSIEQRFPIYSILPSKTHDYPIPTCGFEFLIRMFAYLFFESTETNVGELFFARRDSSVNVTLDFEAMSSQAPLRADSRVRVSANREYRVDRLIYPS